MNRTVIKRLEKERELFPKLQLTSLQPANDNRIQWVLHVQGPPQTPYENLTFQMEIQYDSCYPFKPPYIRFLTPMFHPNITPNGLTSNLLIEPWSPTCTIKTLCERAQHLLANPIPAFAYNLEARNTTDPILVRARIIALHSTHPAVDLLQPCHSESAPAHKGTDTHPVDEVHFATDG